MAIAIASKADHAAMERLAARVEILERSATSEASVRRYKRYLLATIIALMACAGTLAAVAVKFIH